MTKAFTLIELLVIVTIVAIVGSLVFGRFFTDLDSESKLNPILFPREAAAQANQKLADEMAEQNRLMRELLNKQNKQ